MLARLSYVLVVMQELEPFGVRVITVITGGVKSNISRSDRRLSRDSLYLPVEAEFERRLKYSQEGAMATTEYAKSVVNHLLRKQPKKYVWQGNKSWLAWFAYTFLPRRIMVRSRSKGRCLYFQCCCRESTLTSIQGRLYV